MERAAEFARDAVAFRDAVSLAVEGVPLRVACVAPLRFLLGASWDPRTSNEYVAGVLLHPWVLTTLLFLVVSMGTFALSSATGDYSMIDRLWSILPPFASMLYAITATPGPGRARLWLMCALTALWGARLSYNYYRKGGYKLHVGEDYRWAYLQEKFGRNRAAWVAFNFVIVSVGQTALLLAISSVPSYEASLYVGRPLGALDVMLAVAFLALLAGETVADEQMWAFQTKKKRAKTTTQNASGAKGFLDQGLFYYSRHPNYFCEVSMWIVFSFFGPTASGRWPVTFSQLGCVILAMLFVVSTAITEDISSQKYPQYAEYQRTTSAIIPFFKLRSSKTD